MHAFDMELSYLILKSTNIIRNKSTIIKMFSDWPLYNKEYMNFNTNNEYISW